MVLVYPRSSDNDWFDAFMCQNPVAGRRWHGAALHRRAPSRLGGQLDWLWVRRRTQRTGLSSPPGMA
jgi:hypothetical protein